MKRFLLSGIFAFIAIFTLAPDTCRAALPQGDVNGDGIVNLVDVAQIKDYIIGAGNLDTTGTTRADATGDGKVDVADIVWDLNHMTAKPEVTSFKINSGAASSTSRIVTLNNDCTGSPTQYLASESSSFAGASWLAWSASPSFTLSSGNETKTVYFKVNNGFVSNPTSDTISLNEFVEMILVPAGTFTMGRTDSGDDATYGYSDELPRHQVTLSAYRIGKYEATNGQYAAVLNWALGKGYLKNSSGNAYAGGSVYANGKKIVGFGSYTQIEYTGSAFGCKTRAGTGGVNYSMETHPMVNVTWYGCVAFCNWLSEKEGWTPCYDLSTWSLTAPNSGGYRLPTEAEWERAAAWDGSKHWIYGMMSDTLRGFSRCNWYYSGYANPLGFSDYPYTSPVGWFDGANISPNGSVQTVDSPSPVGCYDMSGNAWEWCQDWSAGYTSDPQTNPYGPNTGSYRGLRGGGWSADWYNCRSALRSGHNPDSWSYNIGFRLARTK